MYKLYQIVGMVTIPWPTGTITASGTGTFFAITVATVACLSRPVVAQPLHVAASGPSDPSDPQAATP